MRTASTLFLAVLLIAGCGGPKPEDPAQPHQETGPTTGTDPLGAQVTLVLDDTDAEPGGVIGGTIQVSIPDGLHAYSQPPTHEEYIPLSVAPSEGAQFTLDQVEYPEGQVKSFPLLSDNPIGVYEGVVRIPILIVLPDTDEPQVAVSFDVETQLCDDRSCFPPDTHTVSQTVTIRR